MKKCTKCNQIKRELEFPKDKHRKDGLYSYCKQCANKNNKISYNKNIESVKKYRKIHKDYINQKAKEYRIQNVEKIGKYLKQWREEHREYNKKYLKIYYKKHHIPKENPQIPGFKHGMKKTKIYTSWQNMKSRCDNPNSTSYKNYGGRGITYDERWKDFIEFYKDMGSLYKNGLTIERVDVNGNYCSDNCVWIPKGKQSQNTRRNKIIYFRGKRYKFFELAKETGIKYSTLHGRIYIRNIPVEKAIY